MNVFDLIAFMREIRYYFREAQSRRISRSLGLGHAYIAIDKTIYFQCPSSPVAFSVFRDMAFSNEGRREIKEFLALSTGCRSFVDLGASGGFFSVLFAASRIQASKIISVEPDPTARQVLADLIARNARQTVVWKIDGRAVMDQTSTTLFISSGYGAEVISAAASENANRCAKENNLRAQTFAVQCTTLSTILRDHNVQPDLIKVDIESFEYELITSSLDILGCWRPRIMLELHLDLLRTRGHNPELLLASLASLGYRHIHEPQRELRTLLANADSWGILRVGLLVQ